jgi:hypothetical protein
MTFFQESMSAPTEIWLRGNQRLLLMGLVAPGMVLLGSVVMIVLSFFLSAVSTLLLVMGIVGVGLALSIAGLITWVGRLPRVAYDANERAVVMYLPGPKPYAVPLDIVECFFLGSGITQIPGQPSRDVQTKNIVVRLAERAEAWHRRDLTLAIGKWCEGYVTIRGLFCEPLDIEVVKRMNTLLHQAQQAAAKPVPSEPSLVQGQLLTTGAEALQDAPQ